MCFQHVVLATNLLLVRRAKFSHRPSIEKPILRVATPWSPFKWWPPIETHSRMAELLTLLRRPSHWSFIINHQERISWIECVGRSMSWKRSVGCLSAWVSFTFERMSEYTLTIHTQGERRLSKGEKRSLVSLFKRKRFILLRVFYQVLPVEGGHGWVPIGKLMRLEVTLANAAESDLFVVGSVNRWTVFHSHSAS